jgi:hypothetical protein
MSRPNHPLVHRVLSILRAALPLLVSLACFGCQSGKLSDGRYVQPPSPSTEQALYESRVKTAADRLRVDNPNMTRSEAEEKARKDNPYTPTTAELQAQSDAYERAKKQEAQDKLVKDLDKLKR